MIAAGAGVIECSAAVPFFVVVSARDQWPYISFPMFSVEYFITVGKARDGFYG